MRNNQNQAKLKANIAEIVGPLLKRLKLAKEKFSEKLEMVEIIEQIKTEVVKTKVSLDSIQNWDGEQIGHFGKIERQFDPWIDHNDGMTEMDESTIRTELKDILSKLSHKPSENTSDLPQNDERTDVPESSNRNYQENELSMDLKDLETLDVHSSLCLYSLGIFPESTELKKRFVIYWWTGLGLVPWFSWEKAKLHGHNIFSYLVSKGFLKPVYIKEHNQVIDRCTIDPKIHKWLLSANKKNDFISYDKREDFISPFFGDWFNMNVLVNVDQRYLTSKDISTKNNLQVIQLGSWRYIETEVQNRAEETGSNHIMSNDHIEVDQTDFLKKLGEKATYLSLQGISGIEEVHETIGKLKKLMILDLRTCHNLDKLPQKPRSTLKKKLIRWKLPQKSWLKKLIGWELSQESWFKKLMVLDISECYLLDYMPKWICELSNLEVLKGFVVGSMGNKNQFCRLGDLSKLNKLRKLTIRIAREHLVTKDFSGLKPLQTLLVLTIIWGDNKSNSTIPANSFPENLEKLDIRCYPAAEAFELLNPAELKNLKRLYIRGGKLTKIPCNKKWKVEILRLRYLKNLVPSDWNDLRSSFENLRYVEYVECSKPKNFPNDGSSWRLQESLGDQNVVENELDSLSFSGEIEERVDHPRKEENLTQEIAPIINKGSFFGDDMIEKDMDPTGITRIVKIIIYHSTWINGLIVYFERNGTTQCTDLWGSKRGSLTEINLKTNEYITSVKGHVDYYGSVVFSYVKSLVLITNLAIYGPYGTEYGTSFEFPADLDGQIIGFHGHCCSDEVNALGVYVRQSTDSIIKQGPFIGDGNIVKHMDPRGITRIVKISIYHSNMIDGLTVHFERNGTVQCTDLWGTNEGTLTEINLKRNEYITSVKGYRYFHIIGRYVVSSLLLETNLAVYGPYGTEKLGESFEYTDLHSQIIGFFALVGNYLHNVGVYIQALIRKSVLCGGDGGSAEDMNIKGFTSMVNVSIRHGDAIDALSVCYDRERHTSLWGGNTGVLTKIDLKENEYITSVRGYVGYFGDLFIVRSLELITNLNPNGYGPYGKAEGTPFELSVLGGQIIGFHGRSGVYLDAIGVYVMLA